MQRRERVVQDLRGRGAIHAARQRRAFLAQAALLTSGASTAAQHCASIVWVSPSHTAFVPEPCESLYRALCWGRVQTATMQAF